MEPTIENLIQALRDVSDEGLDLVHQLHLNPITDRTCPRAGQFVLRVLRIERLRRKASDAASDLAEYPIDDPCGWPTNEIIAGAAVAISASNAALAYTDLPTVNQFCRRMVELFFEAMGGRLLMTEREVSRAHG